MNKHLRFVRVCILTVAGLAACERSPKSDSLAQAQSGADDATATRPPWHAKFSLQWIDNDMPQTVTASIAVPVQVRVKNTGDWTWPDPRLANPVNADGAYAVRLGYSWNDPDGQPRVWSHERGELSASVLPGEIANYRIKVNAPKDPGNYELQFDLVEELVTWFSRQGTEVLTLSVTVQ